MGSLGLYAVGVTWPVSLFLPSVRNPELCMHPDHLLARDEARRHFERVEEALQRERGTA
ncbi:hypothetical protein Rhow_002359 [Rhodococcus wratislaviensis]|uniref:Uncharacterized protein n=1 Tax=Rhodococcus wratislaviensis TaxID=44752 RepID=A0A402C5B2_RHOWR|nr:hypothetical protein Rhow_002359 [Rhodococcus wratislaviensis]